MALGKLALNLLLLSVLFVPQTQTQQVRVNGSFDRTPKLPKGASISFTCSIENKNPSLSARMLCPLGKVDTVCFENCNRICVDSALCAEEPRLLRVTCSQSGSGAIQNYTYYLNGVDTGFNGDWGCKYTSVVSLPVQMTVYPSPAIQSISFSLPSIIESQTTVATCVAQDYTGSLQFAWSRSDGFIIPYSSSMANATTSRLVLDNVRRSDTADYICTVRNEVGAQAIRQVSLIVNHPPASVRLTASLASPLAAGVTVTFTCLVDGGKPEPAKRYFRQRSGQSREEIQSNTVTLDPADNAASFFCKAESVGIIGIEIWSAPITFAVFFPPSGLDLLESPNGSVSVGGPGKQFTCSSTSSSNPPSTVLWYSVSPAGLLQQITDSRLTIIQTDGPNSAKQLQSRLEITPDRSLNGYTFRCILQYDSREISRKEVSLQVTFPPDSSDLQATPNDGVVENTALTLVCQTSASNPAPRISWTSAPRDLASPVENVTVHAVTTIKAAEYSGMKVSSQLLVTQTARGNDGTVYTCAIQYSGVHQNFLSKSASLRVFYPPNVNLTVSPDSPREGQHVTLTCLATGGNPNALSSSFAYVWRYQNISGGWTTLSNAGSSLVISSASSTDNGIYQCSVGSRGGSATASANLLLIFAPVAWPGTQTTVSAVLGQVVVLSLRILANPPPTAVTWYRLDVSGAKQALDSRLETSSIPGNQTYSLRIPGVSVSDYSNYVCAVVNPVGARDFQFSLNKPGPPLTPTHLQLINTTAVSAQVRWRSEFNGGFEQTFTLQWRTLGSSVWSLSNQKTGLRDPGYAQTVQESILALESQTTYYIRVRAENHYNGAISVSPFTDEISLTTRKMPVIPDASLAAQVVSGQVEIQFTPPITPYYTNVYVKLCNPDCVLRQILDSEVRSGRATVLLPDPDVSYRYSLVVRDGEVTVYETKTFEARNVASTQPNVAAAGLSFEIVLGISIGSAVVVAILMAAVIITAILQCRHSSGVDKSVRSTNSSDVTNGSGSPAGVCGQAVQLAYRSSVSSAPQDGYYCPPPPLSDECGFSPGSRLSSQEVPLFPYYQQHSFHQYQQMMIGAATSRQRLNGTSNGSLNSQNLQHQQQQHQRIRTPDLVQSETAIGGPTELVRYNSRVSLASSRSGFSPASGAAGALAAPSPGPFASLPVGQSPALAVPMTDHQGGFIFSNGTRPIGNGGGASAFDSHGRFTHALSDSGCGFLGLQPTYVATPLSPHMESNMEAIENYV